MQMGLTRVRLLLIPQIRLFFGMYACVWGFQYIVEMCVLCVRNTSDLQNVECANGAKRTCISFSANMCVCLWICFLYQYRGEDIMFIFDLVHCGSKAKVK